jgi:adenylate cyclase class 2
MDIEYEATFINVNKETIRKKLKSVGAKLIKPEFMQKRVVFNLPSGHEIEGAWLRVRDESDKITMSLKVVDGDKIDNQKEICLEVNNFQQAEQFLSSVGCDKKAYQESKRELWILDNVEITIDEWPFLEPFVEIEGKSEEEVRKTSKKLDFNYDEALFCSADTLYSMKYRISEYKVNNETPEIRFDMNNPFISNSENI